MDVVNTTDHTNNHFKHSCIENHKNKTLLVFKCIGMLLTNCYKSLWIQKDSKQDFKIETRCSAMTEGQAISNSSLWCDEYHIKVFSLKNEWKLFSYNLHKDAL